MSGLPRVQMYWGTIAAWGTIGVKRLRRQAAEWLTSVRCGAGGAGGCKPSTVRLMVRLRGRRTS